MPKLNAAKMPAGETNEGVLRPKFQWWHLLKHTNEATPGYKIHLTSPKVQISPVGVLGRGFWPSPCANQGYISTLDTVNNMGNPYAKQGKLIEVEEMSQRALRGFEKAWGPDHISTLEAVNNLGNLYADQGKLVEVGEMY